MTRQAHSEIATKVLELRDELSTWGIDIPFALKRRDPKEPGRRQKEEFEDKIFALLMKQFRAQRNFIKDLLERVDPGRKTIFDRDIPYYMGYLGEGFYSNPKLIAQLSKLLTGAAQHGIELFGASTLLQMDYTLTNVRAAEWASKYSAELIKGINGTTKKALRRVFKSFIDTPGMTIGDVVKLLPYDESRALSIATTEITRTYGAAAEMAGQDLQKEFPGVEVIKTWWTNHDDRVCILCGPMHGLIVNIGEGFAVSLEGQVIEAIHPPLHVNCRCWISTTTRIVEQ